MKLESSEITITLTLDEVAAVRDTLGGLSRHYVTNALGLSEEASELQASVYSQLEEILPARKHE